jgi:hypothetical protein
VTRFSGCPCRDRPGGSSRPGDDPTKLRPNEFYGYGVDSGTAAFLDASAAPWLCRLADDGYGPLLTKLDGKLRDPATGPNVVAFESG